MFHRIKLVRELAFAGGIAVALIFGTGQALARPGCSTPITACVGQGPNFCEDWCDEEYGYGGICNTRDDCCLCYEK